MDGIMAYWPVTVFVVSVLLIPALSWAVRKGLATKDDLTAAIDKEAAARAAGFKAIDETIGAALRAINMTQTELANRTLKIEAEMEHLPSAEDVNEIKVELSRTSSKIDGLDRETQSITRALTRVENHLLKGAT